MHSIKMRYIKTKVVLLLVLMLLCVLIAPAATTIVYAESLENNLITIEDCQIAGVNWLNQNYDNETIINDIIPIMTGNNLASYCVNFKKNDLPNGYVVIDANKSAKNFVIEFCLSGKGIYDTLYENVGLADEKQSVEKVIYTAGAYEYAVALNDEKSEFYASSDKFLTKRCLLGIWDTIGSIKQSISDKRTNQAKKEYYDGFFTAGAITSSGGYSSKTITGANTFTPSIMGDFVPTGGYTGNCSPTASANLLSYYKEIRGFSKLGNTRQEIYDNCVAATKWDKYGSEGQSASKANDGMKKVVKDAGYTFKSATYWFDYWSDWTRDLKKNYPVYTSIRGLKKTGGAWTEVGHAVISIGYREYGNGARYLQIYDGWNRTSDKYIWFNSDYFKSINGIRTEVK